jgi:hypothetical protein
MRHAALLGIAILLGACENPTTPRTLTHAFGSPRAIILDNSRLEVFSGAINDCSGEFLALEVKFHHVFAFTADGSGGFHFKIHTNAQGQATNPVTGVNYVIMEEINRELNLVAGVEATSVLHFNMIAKGPAPNEVLQADFHLTVTPNGEVSSFHNHFVLQCQQ